MKTSRLELIIGSKFNRLVVVGHPTVKITNGRKRDYYECLCECGSLKTVERSQLISKKTKSCGCLLKDTNRQLHGSPNGEASFGHLYSQIRSGAMNRNYSFEITYVRFKQIVSNNCHHCGSEPLPYNRYAGGSDLYGVTSDNVERSWIMVNRIDRLDNSIGYTEDNSVPCCVACNEMKLDRTEKDFIEHAIRIAEFQKAKK